MTSTKYKTLYLTTFLWIVQHNILGIYSDKNTTITQSSICKKCTCDIDDSLLDCTQKLNSWLSNDEWDTLTNGDFVFETIKLEHNNLTYIPGLPKYDVKNLYLGNNQIDEIELGAFQNLKKLTVLDLSNNKLNSTVLKPDVFRGEYTTTDYEALENLKTVNLGYNQLHSLHPDLFEHVPNIEELILCSNSFQLIDTLTESAISVLSSLKVLDISYIEIKSVPDTILHGPPNLETLLAAGNLLTELPKALEHSKKLVNLVLNENPIGNLEGDNVFSDMPNLKYLSLAYMPEVKRIGPGAFSELQSLTEIILSDNKFLVEIDEKAFAKNTTKSEEFDYPPLEKLYLNNCNLSRISRELIVRWDKLTVLDLRYNPWICDQSNKHLVNILLPQVSKTTPLLATNVKCALPLNLKDLEILTVNSEDLLEKEEVGSLFWIGLIVFVLIVIPISLGGVIIYRRGRCQLFKPKNRNGSRALYNRASFDEDFHI